VLLELESHLINNAAEVRLRRYGVIEIVAGRLERITFRAWPKLISLPEVWWLGGRYHACQDDDRCWLYYNQPRRCPNYLALKYVVSSHRATFATIHRAALVLDEVARLKQSDAIVCEASNLRISDRLLERWGWERHCLDSPRRHYIKRFYGSYPRGSGRRGNDE
jgi:hypothetical protein